MNIFSKYINEVPNVKNIGDIIYFKRYKVIFK